jgi:hypothetical protein
VTPIREVRTHLDHSRNLRSRIYAFGGGMANMIRCTAFESAIGSRRSLVHAFFKQNSIIPLNAHTGGRWWPFVAQSLKVAETSDFSMTGKISDPDVDKRTDGHPYTSDLVHVHCPSSP